MILSLAGVPHAAIAADYVLSRIGIEPGRKKLEIGFSKAFGTIDYEKPGIREMAGVSIEAMTAFLKAMEDKYGSADGYLKVALGFSEEDVEKIKSNLVS